jgi:hypothetical protein
LISLGKPDPPAAPNPVDTARASTSTNVGTSIANAFLNNTNQITPEGSLRYDVTGDYTWYDPYTNTNIQIPTFTATQQLSQQQKDIYDQSTAAKYNLAGMANQQSARLSSLLGREIDLGAAPAAGDPSGIRGIGKAATEFGDVGSQLREFGDAGAITRSYGPSDNFSADRQRVEESLFGRLNPQLDRERANIEQRLADQGIRYGSPAYTAAMDDYNRQATDTRLGVTAAGGAEQQRMMDMAAQRAGFQNAAQQQDFMQQQARGQFYNAGQAADYTQAAGRAEFGNAGLAQQLAQEQTAFNAENMARNQYMNEQYALRNQPINEISALLSGSQISNPNFVNTPNNQIPTTDVAGLINNRFSQGMDIYKQESANNNALIGGALGFAGNLAKLSDVREKEDIDRMGTVFAANPQGEREELPIYEYSYKKDPTSARHVGPMAQDVEKIDKRAVKTKGGTKYIDMARMGSILKAA